MIQSKTVVGKSRGGGRGRGLSLFCQWDRLLTWSKSLSEGTWGLEETML